MSDLTLRRVVTLGLLAFVLFLYVTLADVYGAEPDAARYCQKAGCVLPVSVVIDQQENMPEGVLAHTTVQSGRCVLTFTAKSVRSRKAVAHEVCHCAEPENIGPYGWEDITKAEEKRREARVIACAKEMGN